MKIGKYPVKHSYKIPRIIADVFSVGLAVFICSVEIMFMTVYDDTLKTYIGGEALEKLMQADSSLGWKHWLTLIFPAAVLAVFAVYIVLVLKSHRLKGFNVTKRNAQKLYDKGSPANRAEGIAAHSEALGEKQYPRSCSSAK